MPFLQNTGGNDSGVVDIGNTIDQSGLSATFTSGSTDFDTYLATNPTHTFAFADLEWFTPPAVHSSMIVYDLGAGFSNSRLALWNEDAAGILSMTVQTSNDSSFATVNPVGVFAPANNPSFQAYPAEVFRLTPTNAQFVRLLVTGPQVPFDSDRISMGEIAFDTNSPTTAIPEPSSLALLSVAAVAMAMGKCRRRMFLFSRARIAYFDRVGSGIGRNWLDDAKQKAKPNAMVKMISTTLLLLGFGLNRSSSSVSADIGWVTT